MMDVRKPSSLDLLPKPFDWIPIPAGQVKLVNTWDSDYPTYVGNIDEKKSFTVAAFSIAKYPLTNDQFRLFVDAKGYEDKQWWTQAGWGTRQKRQWTEPRYWQDAKWNDGDSPVVGVSWYEAQAYCRWLSALTGESITLPTEQQWQRAAQGDDGRAYPWGSEWDGTRCNNSVRPQSSERTSKITHYEGKGDSPFKVVDMSGNVSEWCLNDYGSGDTDEEGTEHRVLRGGSWFDLHSGRFKCDDRYWDFPYRRNDDGGFRLALS